MSKAEKFDGKIVEAVELPNGNVIWNTAEKENGRTLVVDYMYHGEYDSLWVCVLDSNGKEVSRYNFLHITSVSWLSSV